jgi:membrane protein YdbS with pleckstrin-like domain
MFTPPEPQLKRLLRDVSIVFAILGAVVLTISHVVFEDTAITSRALLTNGIIYLVFITCIVLIIRTTTNRSKYRLDSTGITIQYRREGRTDEINLQPGDIEKHYLSTRWIFGKYRLVDLILVTKNFDVAIEAISSDNCSKILAHLKLQKK